MQTASLVDSCSPALCASQGGCNLRVDSKKGNDLAGGGCPPSSPRSGLFENHARDKKRTQNPVIVSKDNPVEFDTKEGRKRHPSFPSASVRKRGKQRWMRTRVKWQNGDPLARLETHVLQYETFPACCAWGLARKSGGGGKTSPCGELARRTLGGRHRWVGERRFDRKKESNFSFPVSPPPGPFRPVRSAGFQAVPPSLVGKPTRSSLPFGCGKGGEGTSKSEAARTLTKVLCAGVLRKEDASRRDSIGKRCEQSGKKAGL